MQTKLLIKKQLGPNYKKSQDLEEDDYKSQGSQENLINKEM
jgi:hypothetical protein